MFVPLWLYPFQRRLFSLRALKSRNARRRPPVHCRVQLCLESLEDRLAPSADLVTVAAGNLSTSFSESTQKLTLTATVQDATNSSTTVNEGTVTFTVRDQSGQQVGSSVQGHVSNGSTSAAFILPAGEAVGNYTINVSYSDTPDNFTDDGTDTHGTLTVNAAATTLSLTSVSIVPNLNNGTAQLTLTAQVSNPNSTVNEGIVTFTVAGVSGQGNVSNGTATVQLTVPLLSVTFDLTANMSYTDSASTANFANSSTSKLISTNVWNALLPAHMTLDSNGNQQMQFSLADLPLFSYIYSSSNGLLSQIRFGSSSIPVTYATTGNSTVADVGSIPWGVVLYNSSGQFVGVASVGISADGTPVWIIRDANNQPVAEMPYGS